MMASLTDTVLANHLRLGVYWVEKSRDCASFYDTVEEYLANFDIVFGNVCPSQLLDQLKDHIRDVSGDLAAVSFSDGASGQTIKSLRVFWTSVLAILLAHTQKKCIYECLVSILTRIHSTTRLLRLPKPLVEDISQVDKLLMPLIGLLSHCVPERFLLLFHLSTDPDRILNDPQVQSYLDDLSLIVRGFFLVPEILEDVMRGQHFEQPYETLDLHK
ncbi:hypothetical protein DL96DRAFT_894583 [Flagelloscypha sp. PMI_526]|nr:hypothetical protein DL96DRAFT_894583 [Flagelloscypha sp. PMI_526]